jgi:predicted nucleic acid-binding protein
VSTYIDTALFVKAFILEADSPETIALLESVGEPFGCTHLHELEIPNAIRLKRFRGEITKAQETAAIRAFRTDVEAGRFDRLAYNLIAVFIRAEQLSAKYAGDTGTRSLDLWHIAAALEAGCTAFASYDARQRTVAELCGLTVIPAPAASSRKRR